MFNSTILSLVLVLLLGLRRALAKYGRRPRGLPPGPPTLPLLGNIHQLLSQKPYLQYQKWAEEYGPVYSVIFGSQLVIVLSSDQAVKDVLDKRSGIYSSRPDMYVANGVLSGGMRLAFMKYGETWRALRGLVHNSLNIRASSTYVPYQDLETKAMLLGLLDTPARFVDHIRRSSNSFSTQMVFGFRAPSIDDTRMKQLFIGFNAFTEVGGSLFATMLDAFPVLRRLPDALLPTMKYAKELHAQEREFYVSQYNDAKKRLKEGTSKPCFCVDAARTQAKGSFSDNSIGYVSGTLLEAGSDTTSSTLIGFVQALLCFPEVAVAAEDEIDRVCGDRFPTLDDISELPYIMGCVKESLRWMPTVVMGLPHASIREDEYMGYRIPKGATVICNIWGIHNDANRYPDPRKFDPTRWLHNDDTSEESALSIEPSKRDHFSFGAGRRLCPGMHIADRTLFLAISRLVWAFDFRRTVDDTTGKETVPDPSELTEGLIVMPRPFKANVTPRNERRAECIRAEWSTMKDLLDEEGQWKQAPEGLVWKLD